MVFETVFERLGTGRKFQIELKKELLRLENVKDGESKFQFWTNLPNHGVFGVQ